MVRLRGWYRKRLFYARQGWYQIVGGIRTWGVFVHGGYTYLTYTVTRTRTRARILPAIMPICNALLGSSIACRRRSQCGRSAGYTPGPLVSAAAEKEPPSWSTLRMKADDFYQKVRSEPWAISLGSRVGESSLCMYFVASYFVDVLCPCAGDDPPLTRSEVVGCLGVKKALMKLTNRRQETIAFADMGFASALSAKVRSRMFFELRPPRLVCAGSS